MTTYTIIRNVLDAVIRRDGRMPDELASAMKPRGTYYRPRGGELTAARPVAIGEAWLLWEYPAKIKKGDPVPDMARFDPNVSHEIPQLAGGRDVRYYLSTNMGRRGWRRFISIVRKLEPSHGEFLTDEQERILSFRCE